jgi:hypothetical protein
MNRAAFRKQIAKRAAEVERALRQVPEDQRTQALAALYLEVGAASTPILTAAQQAYAKRREAQGYEATVEALRRLGTLDALVDLWSSLGQDHYSGPELDVLATWLIDLASSAHALGELPYAVGNWSGSWRQVGTHAVAACERLAAAALARDPACDAALELYAQDDFLASVNRTRATGAKLSGPPVSAPSVAAHPARIAHVVAELRAGAHPLDVPSLDSVAVDAPEIVDALLAAIDCAEYRVGLAAIAALGRVTVDAERVVTRFVAILDADDDRFVDHVCMALHYGLGQAGIGALPALVRSVRRVLSGLKEEDHSYRHRWPLMAILSLAPHARGRLRREVASFIAELSAELAQMPAWKQEQLIEFRHESPVVLAKLRCGRPRGSTL